MGPTSTGHLVARLGARLTERMTPLISQVEDEMGDLEERLLESEPHQEKDLKALRSELVRIRQTHHRAETFPIPAAHGTGDAVQRKRRYALDEPVGYRSIS